MKQAIHSTRKLRTLGSRCCGQEYHILTRILGNVAELHAVHLKTGERFVARASEWDTVLNELDQLLIKYGPNESPLSPVAARQTGDMDRAPFVSRVLTSVVRRLRGQTGRN